MTSESDHVSGNTRESTRAENTDTDTDRSGPVTIEELLKRIEQLDYQFVGRHSHSTVASIVGTSPDTLREVYDRADEYRRMNRVADDWLSG